MVDDHCTDEFGVIKVGGTINPNIDKISYLHEITAIFVIKDKYSEYFNNYRDKFTWDI